MPGIDFKAVRALVSMAQVLEIVGFVATEVSGLQRRGPCPVHRSSSPSSRVFSVNLQKNVFRCFRCGAEGNQLDLYAAVTRESVYQAALDLCQRLGIDPPRLKPPRQGPRTEKRNS